MYNYICQCVLTRNMLALGALTQLVWARGTSLFLFVASNYTQALRMYLQPLACPWRDRNVSSGQRVKNAALLTYLSQRFQWMPWKN